jgi:hypothetical protein
MQLKTGEIVRTLADVAARVQNLEYSLNLPMAQDAKTRADICAALLQGRRIALSYTQSGSVNGSLSASGACKCDGYQCIAGERATAEPIQRRVQLAVEAIWRVRLLPKSDPACTLLPTTPG